MNKTNEKRLSPKLDIVFQKLFGEPKAEGITADFLEKILKKKINKIDLSKTTKVAPDMPEDKKGILDVRVEIDNMEKCDIEMQRVDQQGLGERMLFYWSKLFTEGFEQGESYEQLKKTIIIMIIDFKLNILKELGYHTKWKIIEEGARIVILTDKFEIHIIDLTKITGMENEKDELLDWLFFLDDPNTERAEKAMEKNEKIEKAKEELEKLEQDEEMQRMALRRAMALSDQATNIAAAEERGRQKEKEETALKMLEKQTDISYISEITGLTEEEIKKIREKMQKGWKKRWKKMKKLERQKKN